MQLHLDKFGHFTSEYPTKFYRVTHWRTGSHIADFTTHGEAVKASYASVNGERYDHRVSEMHISGR
jgi:hypothetical protein